MTPARLHPPRTFFCSVLVTAHIQRLLGGKDALLRCWESCWRRLHAGDVGGEEVDAVAVEVAAGAVVVLGGSWVGMAGEDLRVAERDASAP